MKYVTACVLVIVSLLPLFLLDPASAFDKNDSGQRMEIQIVNDFLDNSDAPVDWVTLFQTISRLGEKRATNSKELLAKVLRQDKTITLIEGTRLPGVMSPSDMLKAASLDALGRLNAREYIADMKEVYQKAGNNTLRRIARENIEALGGTIGE